MLPHRLMSKRAEWSDVSPLSVGGAMPVPVAAPILAEEYEDMLGLLAAVQASGELSHRVLSLTAGLISYNAANYTAWDLRWRCIKKLAEEGGQRVLLDERAYMEEIASDNAKNYQLWNHRRKCAMAIGEEGKHEEMKFTADVLYLDAKHYHAWSHRQAIVAAFGLWDIEESFTEDLILEDVRNNSAWNERMFVLSHNPRYGDTATHELRAREIELVEKALALAPGNPSPYNYLRGLYTELRPAAPLASDGLALRVAEKALALDKSAIAAMELLADIYAELAEAGDGDVGAAAKQAHALFVMLERADPIRTNYWAHRRAELAVSSGRL